MDKKPLKHGVFSWFELQTSDIPGVGRFSVLPDPQAAMLSVITCES